MTLRPRLLMAALAAAGLLTLTGCVTVQVDPAPTPTSDAEPDGEVNAPDDTIGSCVDGVLLIAGSTDDADVSGECSTVRIEGTDLEVDLDDVTVETIEIRGDRIEVDAIDPASVDIEGQENDVDADELGTLSIAGDRNAVDVDGDLGSVRIDGNDNDVEAASIGSITDNGDRNRIR
ncbi:DUF3060 domain-containing protein [Microbacterium koreense]|uniref:DUF3060 domain-containing protein n=1 Tax=Microbacterium koreense TaxID=323761 RepID=A0ABW2ZN27_9MICO